MDPRERGRAPRLDNPGALCFHLGQFKTQCRFRLLTNGCLPICEDALRGNDWRSSRQSEEEIMTSKRIFLILPSALMLFAATSRAQNPPDAQVWLTTVDRSALLTHQPDALRLSDAKSDAPAIEVNDMQQFQPIEGFGFALTGGSAQLLMQMTPERRGELLRQLFTTRETGSG